MICIVFGWYVSINIIIIKKTPYSSNQSLTKIHVWKMLTVLKKQSAIYENYEQLLAMDILVLVTMKNVPKCEK